MIALVPHTYICVRVSAWPAICVLVKINIQTLLQAIPPLGRLVGVAKYEFVCTSFIIQIFCSLHNGPREDESLYVALKVLASNEGGVCALTIRVLKSQFIFEGANRGIDFD